VAERKVTRVHFEFSADIGTGAGLPPSNFVTVPEPACQEIKEGLELVDTVTVELSAEGAKR
jgi:hypothetical protein